MESSKKIPKGQLAELKTLNGETLFGSGDIVVSGGGSASKVIIELTGNYPVKLADANKFIRANDTLTQYFMIPNTSTDNIPLGSSIELKPTNTGAVKIQAASGVTIETPSGLLNEVLSKFDAVYLQHEKTNVWGVYGALKALGSESIDPAAFTIAQATSPTLFWPNVYKSSDFPEVTTTKPYFILYSTDHSTGDGGVWWGEFDSYSGNVLTGFVLRGQIFTGNQIETPFLIKIPTSESGLATETLFLYTHTNATDSGNVAGAQETRLHTTTGGLLHTATYTDRGRPLGILAGENHTGYLRVWKRGVNDYIGHHIYDGTVPTSQGKISTSTNGLVWTRGQIFYGNEGLPTGGVFERSTLDSFKRNGKVYGVFLYKDVNLDKFLAIAELNPTTYLPQTFIKTLFRVNVRTCRTYVEGDTAYILYKIGTDGDVNNANPYYLYKYNLTNLD
jgi:urease beta subunit